MNIHKSPGDFQIWNSGNTNIVFTFICYLCNICIDNIFNFHEFTLQPAHTTSIVCFKIYTLTTTLYRFLQVNHMSSACVSLSLSRDLDCCLQSRGLVSTSVETGHLPFRPNLIRRLWTVDGFTWVSVGFVSSLSASVTVKHLNSKGRNSGVIFICWT